ncbi:MAG: B12-binding domain-containing radical SAM protein, partial [Candidatus Methylomirabilis sp.]|nr:B12-binding domain-containing radical SAM protein [Deltaproteobacteria bacterium]
MRNLEIGLVELYSTVDGSLYGGQSRDIYTLVRLPSRGIDLLAAILRRAGFGRVQAINPRYTNRKGRFTDADLRRLAACDVVGLSVITRTAPQSFELARLLRRVNPEVRILFGGPHPTAIPEEALELGDVVCLHEGDRSIVEVMERIAEDRERPDFSGIAGIAYRDPRSGEVVRTPEREYLTSEELSALPTVEWPEEVLRGVTHLTVNTARGCPYECEYCSVIENFGRGFRFLDDDAVIASLRATVAQARKPIFFGDDIFTAVPSRTKRLMERILSEDLRLPTWSAQVRVESARDPELLALMRRAGCNRVYIGLESINPATLKLWNKHSTVEKNTRAVERYHEAGISVHGMFVLGSEADDLGAVRATVEYAKRLRIDTAQFFAITPLPGPPLTARYDREGRILSKEWRLYDAQHVVVEPGRMTPYALQREIFRSARDFYSVSEAFRFLFRPHDRFYNAGVRIYGRLLTRRIERDSASYVRQLRALAGLEGELDRLLGAWK